MTDHPATAGRAAARDEGAALVLTMMVVVLVTVLTTTVLGVTTHNLGSAARSRDAAAAVDAAEAGVAQALAYLRRSGTHGLRCSPVCAANPWGNRDAPAGHALPGSARQSFTAWIEPVAPFPDHDPALYRVHAVGRGGSGVRAVEVDVALGTPGTVPLGLFGRTVEGGGDYSLARTSVFSSGCVYDRAHIDFTVERDAAYGIPTGVHSSQVVTESNGNNRYCAGTTKAIHQQGACNPAYPHDQDTLGGSLLSTACGATQTDHPDHYGPRDLVGDAALDVEGSYLRDDATLRALFGIAEQPFSDDQLDELRALARSQGGYYTGTSFSTPDPAAHPHSVLFFDLAGPAAGGIVDLKDLEESAWGRGPVLDAGSPLCRSQSLLVVIVGGNVRLNAGERLAASIVLTSPAPYGKVFKHNGTARLIGTLYADHVDLSGTADLSLDQCFLSNLSPALLSADTERYVEVDR